MSKLLESVRRDMASLHEIGLASAASLKQLDQQVQLHVEPLTAIEIKGIRESTGLSRETFALYLNVSSSTVGGWEKGKHQPSGAALKLLTLVRDMGVEILYLNDPEEEQEGVTDDFMADRDLTAAPECESL